MPKAMTLNVRVSSALGDFVAANVGETGAYENVSEYVRDLIRRDKARVDADAFERLKAELAHENARRVHPGMEIIDVSSTTGEGMDRWMEWLKARQNSRIGNKVGNAL